MFTVYVNGVRVEAEGLQYTCVDPGGFETCSFTVNRSPILVLPGHKILVLNGMEIAWQGYVEEPGFRQDLGVSTYNVTGVGAGILLKRTSYSMIYIDRDMSHWQVMSNFRRNLLTATWGINDFVVQPDTSNGAPSFHTSFTGAWTPQQITEAWYDSGPSNVVGRIKGTFTPGPNMNANVSANWQAFAGLNALDSSFTGDLSSDVATTAAGVAVDFDLSTTASDRRWAFIEFTFTTAGGVEGTDYGADWTNIRVFGNHGLTVTLTPTGKDGILASDIAQHAFRQAGGGLAIGAIDTSPITITHSAYYDPVVPEQVVDDMARFLGWHWGVWEGVGIFDLTPRYYFTRPPSKPNLSVNYEDCEQFDVTERFSQMHDSAKLSWSDASGHSGVASVTKPNSRLPSGASQELLIGAGVMGPDEADAYASLLLANDQLESRYAGAVTLPPTVLTSVGRLDSHMIRPGRHRIQIVGMPLNSTQLGDVLERTDSFRVSRLSASVEDGAVRTQVEFDTGASLLDTLNARLEIVQTLAG